MGSLDISSAKQQFFMLVDAISASHLPSFTIWLDAKLAEYKTIGQLKPDTEHQTRETYPEWIAKSLRQNLSFVFPGHNQTSSSSENEVSQTVDVSVRKRRQFGTSDMCSGEKRSKVTCDGSDGDEHIVPEDVMVVKGDPGEIGPCDTHLSRATDSPLPSIQSTFSLAAERGSDFALRQPEPTPFAFSTPSTTATSVTSPHQPSCDSLHRPAFSDNPEEGQYSETVKSECALSQRESVPLFSPSAVATKLKVEPQMPASFPRERSAYSATLLISTAPPVAELVEGRRPSQTFEEAVQASTQRGHSETSFESPVKTQNASSKRQPGARKGKATAGRHYVCAVCSAKFTRASILIVHEQTHIADRPFTCSDCPAMFFDASYLKAHQETHIGQRPHACDECGAKFAKANYLKMHQRAHQGIRPFACGECLFKSSNRSSLKAHLRRHLAERPFACPECSFTSHERGSLKTHLRTHTGERPYRCNECTATFSQPHALTVHQRIHTGERPYPCNHCSAKFKVSSRLKEHLRTHSGDRTPVVNVLPSSPSELL